jgi:hypothetical protein
MLAGTEQAECTLSTCNILHAVAHTLKNFRQLSYKMLMQSPPKKKPEFSLVKI